MNVLLPVSVSRYRIRSISFCLNLDLTYVYNVTTLIWKTIFDPVHDSRSSYVILLYLKLQHMSFVKIYTLILWLT